MIKNKYSRAAYQAFADVRKAHHRLFVDMYTEEANYELSKLNTYSRAAYRKAYSTAYSRARSAFVVQFYSEYRQLYKKYFDE